MFECRGEDSEHYQAPFVVAPNCCLAEQSHPNLTDRRHGRKLSDFSNATVRDTGDLYARQHSNLRSTSVLLFERQNCRFSPLPPRYHRAGRDSVTLHSTTAVNDSRTVSLLRKQSTGQYLLRLVHPLYLIPSFQVSLM